MQQMPVLPGLSRLDPGRTCSNCRNCRNNTLCLPVAVASSEWMRLEAIIEPMQPVAAGAHLFSSGDRFTALYAIHSGSIKTCVGSEAGVQHITGFHLPAELTGFDGIASGIHTNDGVAMETTTVCRIPYLQLLQLMRKLPLTATSSVVVVGATHCGRFQDIPRLEYQMRGCEGGTDAGGVIATLPGQTIFRQQLPAANDEGRYRQLSRTGDRNHFACTQRSACCRRGRDSGPRSAHQ